MFDSTEEIYYSLIAGVALMFFVAVIFVLTIIKYQNSLNRHQRDKLKLQAQFAQTLLQSQLEIQEQTLQQLSRELHDNLGQVASLIKINLHTLQLNDSAKANRKLEDTRELTRRLIGDIKSLSVSLSSDNVMQSGLVKALEMEMERINRTELFTARFEMNETIPEIDNNKAIILYRMMQETLNNAVKHSMAQNIHLHIFTRGNFVIFTLTDDGKGFNVEERMTGGGAGLYNLKKRATLIDANLSIKSTPGTGTNITIEFPNIYAPNTSSEASPGG
ncbi:ATP-binding protein [Danxiaibacter flavus]|uniref:histidine kinase n=1 Tax=Danxiaibacter flavus TaxID=3049108 RepID=A0ABV3ZDY3_9BACT|nr:ATP-binding protein [Chitinophagaceae bacterium DXS]